MKLVFHLNLIGVFEPTIKHTNCFIIAEVNYLIKPSLGNDFIIQ